MNILAPVRIMVMTPIIMEQSYHSVVVSMILHSPNSTITSNANTHATMTNDYIQSYCISFTWYSYIHVTIIMVWIIDDI